MEFTLETAIWFVFSIILGVIMISVLFNVDYQGFYNSVSGFFSGDRDQRILQELDVNETIIYSMNLWRECGFGRAEISRSVLLAEGKHINTSIFLDRITIWNMGHLINESTLSVGFSNEPNLEGVLTISCTINPQRLHIR